MSCICAFIDRDYQPSQTENLETLGSRRGLWEKITRFLLESCQMPGEISFGGKKYGWNLWYRRSGKSLVTRYPRADRFVAQVVLGKDQVEKALAIRLGGGG